VANRLAVIASSGTRSTASLRQAATLARPAVLQSPLAGTGRRARSLDRL